MSASKFTQTGIFRSSEYDTQFAIPVSFAQLEAAGIGLNSTFDADAGAGDGYGEILLCRTEGVSNDGRRLRSNYSVLVLQATLRRPEPHWDLANEIDIENQHKIDDLWESLETDELRQMIDKDSDEWDDVLVSLAECDY